MGLKSIENRSLRMLMYGIKINLKNSIRCRDKKQIEKNVQRLKTIKTRIDIKV